MNAVVAALPLLPVTEVGALPKVCLASMLLLSPSAQAIAIVQEQQDLYTRTEREGEQSGSRPVISYATSFFANTTVAVHLFRVLAE